MSKINVYDKFLSAMESMRALDSDNMREREDWALEVVPVFYSLDKEDDYAFSFNSAEDFWTEENASSEVEPALKVIGMTGGPHWEFVAENNGQGQYSHIYFNWKWSNDYGSYYLSGPESDEVCEFLETVYPVELFDWNQVKEQIDQIGDACPKCSGSQNCNECNGGGGFDTTAECGECGGSGYVDSPEDEAADLDGQIKCPDCDYGEVEITEDCQQCSGSGTCANCEDFYN